MKMQVWQAANLYAVLVECRECMLVKKNRGSANLQKIRSVEYRAYLRYQRKLKKVIQMMEEEKELQAKGGITPELSKQVGWG